MFKALSIYRLAKPVETELHVIQAALEASSFVPCGATQDKSMGFFPPRGHEHDPMVEVVANRHLIMRVRIETKTVPGDTVRKEADAMAAQIETTTGRKPGRKEMKALKEDALLALLPQAFSRAADVWVWVDLGTERVIFNSTSQGRVGDAVTAIVRALPDFPLSQLQTTVTPATAMTQWLLATNPEDWPADLSVERECELKSGGEDKATVRFSHHNLVNDDVRKHIGEGKLPTRLAMSHNGRVSFVLTEALQLKKIDFLEGVFEDGVSKEEHADAFDADLALATGELTLVLDSLINALGGRMEFAQSQAPKE